MSSMLESCKPPMHGLYYLATLPQRKSSAAKLRSNQRVPVMVLFYHRVADEHPNDWTISTEAFRRQMEWLAERFDVVSLREAQSRISSEKNDRPTVAITFDDGYSDNCATAIPYLLERKLPFTYFVTTVNVTKGQPFSHDVERGCPLAPNSIDELREMAAAGVEIGAHTITHPDLGSITDDEVLYREIVEPKRELESLLECPVRYFAFPFGLPENMSTTAFEMAFQAGYWGVCSAYGGYNLPGEDSFHLQRIHGDPEWARFRNWLTVDPRKLKQKRLFQPGDYRSHF